MLVSAGSGNHCAVILPENVFEHPDAGGSTATIRREAALARRHASAVLLSGTVNCSSCIRWFSIRSTFTGANVPCPTQRQEFRFHAALPELAQKLRE